MSRTNEAHKKACSLVIDGDKLKGSPKRYHFIVRNRNIKSSNIMNLRGNQSLV